MRICTFHLRTVREAAKRVHSRTTLDQANGSLGESMSEERVLKLEFVAAMDSYREAFAKVEALTQEQAALRREIFEGINHLDYIKRGDGDSRASAVFFSAGRAAVSQMRVIQAGLNEAIVTLDSARQDLIDASKQGLRIP